MRSTIILIPSIAVALASCGSSGAEGPLRGEPGHINERTITVDVYRSLNACVTARRVARSECDRAERSAMSKHPRYAEKFEDPAVCEEVYGAGACDTLQVGRQRFSSPRPIGFLVCNVEASGCSELTFAPVYRNREWGEFTGAGGGYISPSSAPAGRSEVSGVVARLPVI